uniref:Cyclin A1-1 n=1 Tax=Dimocarpus longan TaxID=128017 RepID=A0A8G0QX66_9ROSI|nr:cyclin A1-1 [Dimocarpus longan]
MRPSSPKKRVPLVSITNQTRNDSTTSFSSSTLVPCSTKVAKAKKAKTALSTSSGNTDFSGNFLPASLNTKPSAAGPCKVTSLPRHDETGPGITAVSVPCSMDVAPCKLDGYSASVNQSMSACDFFKCPEVEFIDNNGIPTNDSFESNSFRNLQNSDHAKTTGNICNRMDKKVANEDGNYVNPQLCASYATDIYKHLRESEVRHRPSVDYMERLQKHVNARMRATLIDWLVEVAEEYRLSPETLFLTVNYIDRYLSGNVIIWERLQLLGVACMMIAAKYEEIYAPQVDEFCYITDNTYSKGEVLEMESTVLSYLKFEMTAPTAKCFLRHFVHAAQVTSVKLECLASYILELSLLEYNMLHYAPSIIAASATLLANFILCPSKRPWNSTLRHYTLYQPSDLFDCVKALHHLFCNGGQSNLPAIREKYSQHKYKYVAKKHCSRSISSEIFKI